MGAILQMLPGMVQVLAPLSISQDLAFIHSCTQIDYADWKAGSIKVGEARAVACCQYILERSKEG